MPMVKRRQVLLMIIVVQLLAALCVWIRGFIPAQVGEREQHSPYLDDTIFTTLTGISEELEPVKDTTLTASQFPLDTGVHLEAVASRDNKQSYSSASIVPQNNKAGSYAARDNENENPYSNYKVAGSFVSQNNEVVFRNSQSNPTETDHYHPAYLNNTQHNVNNASGNTVNLAGETAHFKDLEVGERFAERRALLQSVCKKLNPGCSFNQTFFHRDYFFYDYNTTVCTIAKAGSSTWRAHLRRVNKGPPPHLRIFMDRRREEILATPTQDLMRRVKASAKVITVRHPLTRLVSTYRQKYKNGRQMPYHHVKYEQWYHKKHSGTYWADKAHQFWVPALHSNNLIPRDIHLRLGLPEPFNPNTRTVNVTWGDGYHLGGRPSFRGKSCQIWLPTFRLVLKVLSKPWYETKVYERLQQLLKPRLSFRQFLHHVVITFSKNKPDAHWGDFVRQCCPCHFDYEYVTKTETMTEDLNYVFNKLGLPSDPSVSMNQLRGSVTDLFSDFWYYKFIPVELKRQIYEIFKVDLEMFGYQLPKNFLTN